MDLLSRSPLARHTPLENPPRPHVTVYVVDGGDRHFTGVVGGVDGGSVAHGYAHVGEVPAAVLAPEEQVSGLWGTADRDTVAHLPARGIGQRDAELLEDQHREAGAVLVLECGAGSRRREHVGGSHVLLGHGENVGARSTHSTTADSRTRSGSRCTRTGRGRRGSVVPIAPSRVSRGGSRGAGGSTR